MDEPADFASVLAAMEASDGGYRVTVPPCWRQGRTTYGGASAAIALAAAQAAESDLPPLRSLQIAFVGPLGGAIEARPALLRRGRSAAFARVDLSSEGATGMTATLLFTGPRESHVAYVAPNREPPPHGETVHIPPSVAFAQNFDLAMGRPIAPRTPSIERWARLRRRDGLDPLAELLLIADVLPPAAMMLFDRHGPISSMTWQLDLLDPAPATDDGWWLLSTEGTMAEDGFTSQTMRIWNSDGRLIAAGTQTVALFV